MKKVLNLLLCSMVVVSLSTFTGCDKKSAVNLSNESKIKKITLPNEKDNFIDLTLYFDSSKDDKDMQISKDPRTIPKEELLGEVIMQELIKGPSVKGELKPILPKGTRLLNFSIKDGIAFVNLSRDAINAMTPNREEACLKSIIFSLTQLSSVQKVKIQIDNKDVEYLGGNFIISNPIGKDDLENARKK